MTVLSFRPRCCRVHWAHWLRATIMAARSSSSFILKQMRRTSKRAPRWLGDMKPRDRCIVGLITAPLGSLSYPRRAQFSTTSWRKPEITHILGFFLHSRQTAKTGVLFRHVSRYKRRWVWRNGLSLNWYRRIWLQWRFRSYGYGALLPKQSPSPSPSTSLSKVSPS